MNLIKIKYKILNISPIFKILLASFEKTIKFVNNNNYPLWNTIM